LTVAVLADHVSKFYSLPLCDLYIMKKWSEDLMAGNRRIP